MMTHSLMVVIAYIYFKDKTFSGLYKFFRQQPVPLTSAIVNQAILPGASGQANNS